MENNEVVVASKNNKGLVILVIILILMVIGLSGFIVYDKIIVKEKPKVEESQSAKTPTTNTSENNETTIDNQNSNTSYNYANLKDFWNNFRSAVLSNDYNEMSKYVQFPLKTRGPYDSDPVIAVEKENFESTFKKFLQSTANDGAEILTQYEWIKRYDYDSATKYLDSVNGDHSQRFSEMIMEKDNNGYWKLNFIYTE